MAEAKLYGQNKGGMSINGIIKDYYAFAKEKIEAGDLVEYVNGVAGKTDLGTSEDTQINTTSQAGYVISAVALDDSRVFITHGSASSSNASNHLYGIVCTINGATITVGTDTQLSSADYSGTTISACLLPNGNVFIAHRYGGSYYLRGMVCTIEGTTITAGTDTPIVGTDSAGWSISACLLPNGNVFIAHSYSSSYHLYGIVVSIDGTTITTGTDKALVSSSKAGYAISTCLLPNGNVFIAHSRDSNYYLYGIVCSINGATITKGSDTKLNSETRCGFDFSIELLPNGNVFIAHQYGSSYSYLAATIVSIEETAITIQNTTNSNQKYDGTYISTCLLPNGNVLITHTTSATNLYLQGIVCIIDGKTMTFGTDTQLSTTATTGYKSFPLLLDNGTIFIAHTADGNYGLNAQIWGVDEANNIPTNNIIATEYETQVRQVTTGQFDGIAKTSGTGGNATGHKDKVSIWTIPVYVEVIKQGNIIPIEWVEESLYQYRADGVTLTAATINADTESAGLYKAYLACDNDTDTYYRGNEESVARYEWLQWEFDEPRKITKMQVRFRGLNNMATDHVSITIQGSNNSNEWADLFSIPLPSSRGYESEITLSNVDYYKYYRIYSRNKQGYLEVHDWYVTEYAVLEEK